MPSLLPYVLRVRIDTRYTIPSRNALVNAIRGPSACVERELSLAESLRLAVEPERRIIEITKRNIPLMEGVNSLICNNDWVGLTKISRFQTAGKERSTHWHAFQITPASE